MKAVIPVPNRPKDYSGLPRFIRGINEFWDRFEDRFSLIGDQDAKTKQVWDRRFASLTQRLNSIR